jgi:hypothetical protein
VRERLEGQDIEKYINSILTAYVVKRPLDLEAGLRVLLQLRGDGAVHSLMLKPNSASPSRTCANCSRGSSQIYYLSSRRGYAI